MFGVPVTSPWDSSIPFLYIKLELWLIMSLRAISHILMVGRLFTLNDNKPYSYVVHDLFNSHVCIETFGGLLLTFEP